MNEEEEEEEDEKELFPTVPVSRERRYYAKEMIFTSSDEQKIIRDKTLTSP